MKPGRRVGLLAALVVTGGVITGVIAGLLLVLLHAVAWLSFGDLGEPNVTAAALGTDPVAWARRTLPPVLGGVLVGLVWWILRRGDDAPTVASLVTEVDAPPGTRRRRHWLPTVADAVMQIILVGTGGSIGRENAPRLAAAGALSDLTVWARVTPDMRRILIASAAGAGLAAVYNVPVTGVVFTCTILLATPAPAQGTGHVRMGLGRVLGTGWSLATLAVSAPMTAIATVIAWAVVGSGPRLPLPEITLDARSLVFMPIGGVAAGVIGAAFSVGARAARTAATRPGWRLPMGIAAMGLVVGAVSFWMPIGGNGLALVEPALAGAVTVPILVAYIIAKPLVTAGYLRTGAIGGLLMPALSTGAAVGATLAIVSGNPTSVAAWCMIAGVAALAASERAWMFAALLGWEMTHAPFALGGALVAAAIVGHLVAVGIDRTLPPRLRGRITAPPHIDTD